MTRRPLLTSAFLPLLAAAFAALLALATLQYHWVGQVTAGERERRQANLSLGADRLREDFDRELARAYLALQMDAATLRDKNWSRYARRLDRWKETAPYPGLVKDVYLVEVNQIGRIGLSRYNSATRSYESVVWPFELMPVRRRIERTFRAIYNQGSGVRADIPPVDRAGPSLLIPVSRPWLLSDQEAQGINADLIFSDLVFPGTFTRCMRCPPELYDTPLIAHTLAVLDRDYIAATFLPSLVERYFPTGGSFEYNIGVVDQAAPDELIFSSDERLDAASYSVGDASVAIFDITYEELNALILASDPRLDGRQPDPEGRIAIGVLGRPSRASEQGLGETGQWRLVLKHRDGSLETAIDGLRMRNLLISFGTLLLLGGSMVMLLFSTRRAQRLAKQQIDFASAVSHELRTPLAVICSAGENLADGLIHDPQKARRYGAVIYNEGRRLTDMVEQVLAFAGAQSGAERYHFEASEVTPILEGAVQGLQLQLREGGYDLSLSVEGGLPPISADAGALRRAIQNLISNAMKYGGDDGWIGVEAMIVSHEGGAELRIVVRDNGAGIDPGDLPHIFEPFYRGRGARATQAHGSGLGLSLVRHTVEAHGGRVSVESRPGAGACFALFLPLLEGHREQGAGHREAVPDLARV
jgi:signal transduction histidine kinase